jgi:hypothetical protein
MTFYPLMFTFRDAVSGNGFLAGITLSGHALITKEDEAWWMYGVRPGALAESGQTPQEAFFRFRNRYREILFDIATEFQNFSDFRDEVERFYYEADKEEEMRWLKAVQDIRSGTVEPEAPFSSMPKEAPESRPSQVTVERLDVDNRRFTAIDNIPDRMIAAA